MRCAGLLTLSTLVLASLVVTVACGDGTDGASPTPTAIPTALPLLDVSNAVHADVALPLLRQVPGLGETIAAVEAADADALLALFQVHVVDCQALGRSAGDDCEGINEAVDGKFDAINIEDAGTRWSLASVRARDLLAELLKAGNPQVVAVTHDRTTAPGTGGTYYVAIETGRTDLSDPRHGYGEGVVGAGFGLRIEAKGQTPIVEFSLLSESWNPLQWLQWSDANPNHSVIFPPDLNEKYPEVYE